MPPPQATGQGRGLKCDFRYGPFATHFETARVVGHIQRLACHRLDDTRAARRKCGEAARSLAVYTREARPMRSGASVHAQRAGQSARSGTGAPRCAVGGRRRLPWVLHDEQPCIHSRSAQHCSSRQSHRVRPATAGAAWRLAPTLSGRRWARQLAGRASPSQSVSPPTSRCRSARRA